MLQRVTTKPIHVLVATPAGATGQGGIDRVMAGLRDALARAGDDTLAITFGATRGSGSIVMAPLVLGRFLLRMIALRARGQLDLVHINLASYGSTYRKLQIARLARWLGVPYVLHLHGGDYPNFWKADGSRLSGNIRSMFAGAAQIIVLGQVWRNFIVSRAPETAGHIVVLPNAAPQPSVAHVGGGDHVHILFLGRINDAKGVPQLGEALFRLKGLPNWRATIAGDGNVDQARTKANELGLSSRVDIPGWVDGPQVGQLIASADVLVLPSFIENLPLSIVEGMASGLAIVATPVGAVSEIVKDNETGLLVQPGDIDGLTRALERLIRDKALRDRLGAAGLELHRNRLDLAPYAEAVRQIWRAAAH